MTPRWNSRIPFLNGGLFEPDERTQLAGTAGRPTSPTNCFPTKTKPRRATSATESWMCFSRYNFTVAEDEPTEREVAVDPEMLGKGF